MGGSQLLHPSVGLEQTNRTPPEFCNSRVLQLHCFHVLLCKQHLKANHPSCTSTLASVTHRAAAAAMWPQGAVSCFVLTSVAACMCVRRLRGWCMCPTSALRGWAQPRRLWSVARRCGSRWCLSGAFSRRHHRHACLPAWTPLHAAAAHVAGMRGSSTHYCPLSVSTR